MAQQNFRGLEEEINYGPHKKKKDNDCIDEKHHCSIEFL